jgi:hypothetical protein
MSLLNTALTAILTSGLVSGLAVFFLRIYVQAAIKHRFDADLAEVRHGYDVELARLRADLRIATETTHEVTERRLLAYPKLGELVYRVRNIAREIANSPTVSATLRSELESRTNELEEKLFESRVDLERDNLFLVIHSYKNAVKLFVMFIGDLRFHQGANHDTEAQEVKSQMSKVYAQIDSQYGHAVKSLATLAGSFPSASVDS